MAEGRLVKQVTLLALARWVSNHTCGTAYKCNRLMAASLKVAEHHNSTQVPYMKRICSWVYTKVCHCHLLIQMLLCTRHDVT